MVMPMMIVFKQHLDKIMAMEIGGYNWFWFLTPAT